MAYNSEQAARELAACPTELPGDAKKRAYKADVDARVFAKDIRVFDHHQLWGRMALMARDQLEALVISLAAGYDPDNPHALDWCRRMGGTAAFHPDYHQAVKTRRPAVVPDRERQILDLNSAGVLPGEIARRVGARRREVERTIERYQTQQGAAA